MGSNKIHVYSYLDYRQYLKDFYVTSGITYRAFSGRVGVKAPNFLQWLIEGKRNLAGKTIPSVVRALGLDENEGGYFKLLVFFGQAKTVNEKSTFFSQITDIRRQYLHAAKIDENQYEYYSNWYFIAIRELLRIYRLDPHEKWCWRKLARLLRPQITETQAKHAVERMLELGILKTNDDGVIVQAEPVISTGDEVKSFFIKQFHETMIELAKGSMDRFERHDRDISSVTMCVSDKCKVLIKSELQQFRKRILDIVKADTTPENVIHLNFQMFPLAGKEQIEKEKKKYRHNQSGI